MVNEKDSAYDDLVEENRLLRSSITGKDIQLRIIENLIDDPNYDLSGSDYDYETTLINKIQELRKNTNAT